MREKLADIVTRADSLFYRMRALADPARLDEREAIEDEFDALYAEAMRLISTVKD